MAVTKLATRTRWIGLSSDTKPTLAAGDSVPVGSTFTESDTRDYYITYDGDNWTKRARNSQADRVGEFLKTSNL